MNNLYNTYWLAATRVWSFVWYLEWSIQYCSIPRYTKQFINLLRRYLTAKAKLLRHLQMNILCVFARPLYYLFLKKLYSRFFLFRGFLQLLDNNLWRISTTKRHWLASSIRMDRVIGNAVHAVLILNIAVELAHGRQIVVAQSKFAFLSVHSVLLYLFNQPLFILNVLPILKVALVQVHHKRVSTIVLALIFELLD